MSESKKLMVKFKDKPINVGRVAAERGYDTPITQAVDELTEMVMKSDKPKKTLSRIGRVVGPDAKFAVAASLAQEDVENKGLKSAVMRTFSTGIKRAEADQKPVRIKVLKNIRNMGGYTWVDGEKINEITEE